MKILFKYILIIFAVLLFGCKKESAPFVFTDREVITVTGIENQYSKISAIDKLIITPEVKSNKEGTFEYMWGIYQANVQLTKAVVDTISFNKDLEYLVNQPADNWVILFRVTNKSTGFSQYFQYGLSVGTQFTRGWYVLKDQQQQSDLDLFLTPTHIIPESNCVENVYSTMNGRKLDGKGTMLRFNSFYKSENASGIFENTRSLFILSENDASVVKVSSMVEMRNFEKLYFGSPEVKKPTMVGNDFLTFFSVNNGQLHSMIGQGPSFGQFGGRKMKNSNDQPYFLSKYHLMNIASYFFDEITSSFYSASDRGLYLTPVKDNPATMLTANENNKKLIYMGLKSKGPFYGVAIFEDKTNPQLKTLNEVYPLVASFRMTNQVLEPTDKIYNGTNFGLLYQDENMIYFSLGREVWSRNLANKFEQLQYTVPSDETIQFIQHRKYAGVGAEEPFSYNYVAVGTSTSNGQYRVRMFEKPSGNFKEEPTFTLKGNGNPRDVIFISPGISSSSVSFPDTY